MHFNQIMQDVYYKMTYLSEVKTLWVTPSVFLAPYKKPVGGRNSDLLGLQLEGL